MGKDRGALSSYTMIRLNPLGMLHIVQNHFMPRLLF